MKQTWLNHLLLGAWLLSAHAAFSLEHVFKFSEPSQISKWQIASQKLDLSLTKRYGIFGGYALRFTSPSKGNLPEWPSCQAAPEVKDWSGFDRLVIDLTNPGKTNQMLNFFISDSKVPFRNAFSGTCSIQEGKSERFVFTLSEWPKHVNIKDVSIMHVYTQRPSTDMDVFIGSIYLLRPGEAFPEYPSAFVTQLRKFYMRMLGKSRRLLNATMERLQREMKNPALVEHHQRTISSFDAVFTRYETLLSKPSLPMDELHGLPKIVQEIEKRCRRLESELKFLKKAVEADQDISKMAVGIASTMTKVMPRGIGSDIEVKKSLEISLARNEREGIQVVVAALSQDLTDVDVTLTTLKNDQGQELKTYDVDVVGFVKTEKHPPYTVSHVGWWPDPLLRHTHNGKPQTLGNCGRVDIRQGDFQPFWLRFYADRNQTPGIYRGVATVKAAGVKPYALPVSVRVFPFNVPMNTALPTAITLDIPKKQMSQKIPYDKMKFIYADFLADYQIDFDNLYRYSEPDWDVLRYLHKQGRLTAFNFGYMGITDQNTDKMIRRYQDTYDKAKKYGLLDYAYIYGFDECAKDKFHVLEKCSAALRKAFPDVLLMTTTFDHSYGLDSVVKSMQAWCPLTPRFNPELVEKARKNGRWVWWYICCWPHNPYCNWFLEYAAIESRLLMGAQTVKFRPDGFLYYCTAIWNDNMGIDCAKGPFTTWNPVSWTVYHGDGSLFYCDSDGYPLPSIRLENYRDGQEDYAYACILEEAIRQIKAKKILTDADRKWLKEAENAMKVPETLVKSIAEYSRNPKRLMAWRNRMAEAITKSGLKDLNPWKGVYGVRGWRK